MRNTQSAMAPLLAAVFNAINRYMNAPAGAEAQAPQNQEPSRGGPTDRRQGTRSGGGGAGRTSNDLDSQYASHLFRGAAGRGMGVGALVVAASVTLYFMRALMWWVVIASCVLRPVYSTMGAMEEHTRDREKRWVAYWSFFGVLSLTPLALVSGAATSSLYPAMLFVALTWLKRNDAANAALVYETRVRPLAVQVAPYVEEVESEVQRMGGTLARMVVDTVQPYAGPTPQPHRHVRGSDDIPRVHIEEVHSDHGE